MSEIESIRREDLETDLAWLAGFIDGEGNIGVAFHKNDRKNPNYRVFRIHVNISNTDVLAIEKVTRILTKIGCFFKVYLRRQNSKKWLPCANVVVQGQRNASKLLRAVEPFLTVKKETARQAIYAADYRNGLRRAFNNQWGRHGKPIYENPVLHVMADRARELVHYRADIRKYSIKASKPIELKKPSETTRLAALNVEDAEDIVRSAQRCAANTNDS